MHTITIYCIYACIFLNIICSVSIMLYICLFSGINVYVYMPVELCGPCTFKYLQRSEAIRFPRIRAIGYCELLNIGLES